MTEYQLLRLILAFVMFTSAIVFISWLTQK